MRWGHYLDSPMGGIETHGNSPSPMSAVEHMAFDSEAWGPADRLAQYSRFNGAPTVARAQGPDFAMRASRWRFDQMVLHERRANAIVHERSAREIADGLDHLIAHLVVSGGYEADSGRGFQTVQPGAIVLLDMRRPMRTRARHSHVLTISVARDVAMLSLGGLGKIHGLILSGTNVMPLADFLLSLSRRASGLSRAAVAPLVRVVGPLLAAAIESDAAIADDRAMAQRGPFDRARLLVDRHFRDPDFSPETMVAKSGLSRTTIYRLFQPHGGLMAFVARRRLEAARLAIAEPRENRAIAAIAADCGFASESHFNRKFSAAYGLSPGAFRKRLSRSPVDHPDPRLPIWFSELESAGMDEDSALTFRR